MNSRNRIEQECGASLRCNEVTRDSWVNTRSPGSKERSAGAAEVKPEKPRHGTGAATDTCGQLGPLMGKDDTDSLAHTILEPEKKKHSKTKNGEEKGRGKKGSCVVQIPIFFLSLLLFFMCTQWRFSDRWCVSSFRGPFSFIEIEALETFRVLRRGVYSAV
ncbi:hypothetical protein AVEN_255094-1 [Araneus ventricosus]|uniref:Uncharacterized protein n=1 Tax=Araneus ventricosus TaxID=182803 RepID=A0A4Y2EG53_ARAVE|nr:hypothetical protein AVEN_255094-1 [Araneus ventricosus]